MTFIPKQAEDAAKAADEQMRTMAGITEPPQPPATPVPMPDSMGTPSSPPDGGEQPASYWKQRFEVIDGKYKAEVPRLQERIGSMELQLKSAMTLIERLQSTGGQAGREPSQNVAPASPGTSNGPAAPAAGSNARAGRVNLDELISAAEFENLEESGFSRKELEALAVLADKIAAKRTGDSETRIEQRIQTTAHASSEDEFFAGLAKHVPNWKAVNADPLWLNWLQKSMRQSRLENAQGTLDIEGVAQVFDLFFKDYPALRAPNAPQSKPMGRHNQDGTYAPPDINNQVTPRPGMASGDIPPDDHNLTQEDIKSFYDGVVSGRFRSMPPDYVSKMDARINRQMLRMSGQAPRAQV
jgi:hypothetical protein